MASKRCWYSVVVGCFAVDVIAIGILDVKIDSLVVVIALPALGNLEPCGLGF
jgi:hypothetical protein